MDLYIKGYSTNEISTNAFKRLVLSMSYKD